MISDRSQLAVGDALARARQAWVAETSRRVAAAGYPGFRRSDTAVLRRLAAGGCSLVELAAALHVTRQAARKIVTRLEGLGHVAVSRDPADARRSLVALTEGGRRYAGVVIAVAESLNERVLAVADPDDVAGALRVLRAVAAEWPTVRPSPPTRRATRGASPASGGAGGTPLTGE